MLGAHLNYIQTPLACGQISRSLFITELVLSGSLVEQTLVECIVEKCFEEVHVEKNADIQFWERYLNHYVLLILDDKSKFSSKKEDVVIGVDSTHVHLEHEGSIGRQYIIRIKSLRENKWEDNPEYRGERKHD